MASACLLLRHIGMALKSSWVIYKATIARRANIPKIREKLTGSVHDTVVSSSLATSSGTTAASPATLQLERRECDSLKGLAPIYHSTCFAKLLRNGTSDFFIASQKPVHSLGVENVAANNANRVICKN